METVCEVGIFLSFHWKDNRTEVFHNNGKIEGSSGYQQSEQVGGPCSGVLFTHKQDKAGPSVGQSSSVLHGQIHPVRT